MLDRKWVYGILGLAALAVIGSAAGLYLKISSRAEAGPVAIAPRSAPMEPAPPSGVAPAAPIPSIEVAADRLAQRLRASDGSGEDWALLARSYVQMRRFPEAVDAFGKALQKMPGDQTLIDEQAAARKAAGAK